MSDPALIAEEVCVRFRPYADSEASAPRSLLRLRHRAVSEVVALDGATCKIERGEAVAVVGPNGAGKSTLLRVLAGTLEPDSGSVEFRTKHPPTLLQLGVGFNGQLSGMHNVYLGGLALGHSRADMDSMLPQIESFADIGHAIHRPVNTYSSGMRSRLAFAVAMTLEPETLLLDEILAVGDATFKRRSMSALQNLVDRAGTVVMVTHSLSQARRFCDSAIWLDEGQVRMTGPSDDVIDAYEASAGNDSDDGSEVETQLNAKDRTRLVRRVLGGETAADVATDVGIDLATIQQWRRRFIEGGRKALRPRFDGDDDDD